MHKSHFMPMQAKEIEARLLAAMPDASVNIVDLAGDNDHFEVTVACRRFRGKTRVEQHKMVYAALGGAVGGALHALSVKTKLPPETHT